MRSLYRLAPMAGMKNSLLRKTSRWCNGTRIEKHATIDGLQFNLKLGDPVDTTIFLEGKFESEITELIQSLASRNNVFYDVGCNIGYFSCLFGRSIIKAIIYAIDANPVMVARCKEHCQLNGINAEIVNFGVGAEAGELEFYVDQNRPSLGSFGNKSMSGTMGIKVPVLPISQMISAQNWAIPTVIKIDIEGFEPSFFQGLNQAHFSGVQHMVIEHALPHMEKCGFSPNDLWSMPRMKEFDYFGLDQNGWSSIPYEYLARKNGMLYGVRKGFQSALK